MPLEKPFDNIVGSVSEEIKEEKSQDFKRELETQSQWKEKYGEYEKEKNETEKEIIRFADKNTSKMMSIYGGGPLISIPEQAVHFIKPEYWNKFDDFTGGKEERRAFTTRTSINLRELPGATKLHLLNFISHEFFHGKVYRKIEINKIKEEQIDEDVFVDIAIDERRAGFTFVIKNRQGERKEGFKWLNEAAVEQLSLFLVRKVIEEVPSRFKEDVEILKRKREEVKLKNPKINEKEWLIASIKDKDKPEEQREYAFQYPLAYYEERGKLWDVIHQIYKSNPDRFKEQEQADAEAEIFGLFAQAMVTGRILEPMRLLYKTYGKKGFRELADWQPDKR